MGRTVVCLVTRQNEVKGLRVLPIGMVEEKEKFQVIHNLTFGGQGSAREEGVGKGSVPGREVGR